MPANRSSRWSGVLGIALVISIAIVCSGDEPVDKESQQGSESAAAQVLPTLHEAQSRAVMLHETIHATLHVVHRDFYREDEGLPIPAKSLARVFLAIEESQNISVRWLAVNAEAMNIDHKPRDEFELTAAAVMTAGEPSHEQAEAGIYRRASTITLKSECLKCHLPNRRSTADRLAGLVISMPYSAARPSTP